MTAGPGTGVLERAREAGARGEWGKALELLRAVDAQGNAGPAELAALAEVAYPAGELDTAINAWERAHALSAQAGDRAAAAGAAVRVALHLLLDTALMAPVRAWAGRAERLLEGQSDSPAHAWLAVVRTYERLLAGDSHAARQWASRAVELGSQHDPSACALGRVAQARLLVLDGDVAQGLALLDEVGAASVGGELDPLATGIVYCELVCALQGLAQYDAAEEWTEAMERWCRTNAIGSLHGRCRVHRAEILRLRGACMEAETEALAACEELRPYLRRELGWPLRELGLIRLRRGDLDGAEEAFLAAHRVGWHHQPGFALVLLTRGDAASAAESIREALERPLRVPSKEFPPDSDLQRAPLLEAQAQIELAVGNVERALAAADELKLIADRFQSKALVAGATLARARVRLAEDDAAEAQRLFAEAVRLWVEVGAPYEAAVARMGLADALRAGGRDHQAELELRAARSMLDDLGCAVGESTTPGLDAAVDTQDAYIGALRREGDYWTLEFQERTVRVRDLKGLRYLALLLARPWRDFHVLDLVTAETGGEVPLGQGGGVSRRALGDAGEALDAKAKDAYRRRLVEIEEDIDQARELGDGGRAEQAEVEREFIVRELAGAVGLGGRDRRAASASERARVAVTRATRHAIAKVRERHPELGKHLERAITTGTYCAYRPDRESRARWLL